MLDGLDSRYDHEVQMANEQFIVDQQHDEIQARQSSEDAEAERRTQAAEARRMGASAEAAMSGLNVSGGTSLRTLGTFDIMESELDDEADMARERISLGHYMDDAENKHKLSSRYKGAEAQRRAGWNPQSTSGLMETGMRAGYAGLSGASSGLSIGNKLPKKKTVGATNVTK